MTLSGLELEPIKTALVAGDYPLARRLRVELLRRIIVDMGSDWQEAYIPKSYARLLSFLDALGIPEE